MQHAPKKERVVCDREINSSEQFLFINFSAKILIINYSSYGWMYGAGSRRLEVFSEKSPAVCWDHKNTNLLLPALRTHERQTVLAVSHPALLLP